MKKWKVMLVELSPKMEDGSRRTVQEKEICSCKEHGTAELILYKIKDNYSMLCKENTSDTESKWFLTIRQ